MVVKTRDISRITDDDWLVTPAPRCSARTSNSRVERSVILLSKVVIKNGTGVIYYTFPLFEEEIFRHLGKRDMDLRGHVPYPSQILEFQVPLSDFIIQNQRHPDKAQLQNTILALRAQGVSYRKIADAVGLHWTRVQQIVKGYNK
jgi:hypothetical protein